MHCKHDSAANEGGAENSVSSKEYALSIADRTNIWMHTYMHIAFIFADFISLFTYVLSSISLCCAFADIGKVKFVLYNASRRFKSNAVGGQRGLYIA